MPNVIYEKISKETIREDGKDIITDKIEVTTKLLATHEHICNHDIGASCKRRKL